MKQESESGGIEGSAGPAPDRAAPDFRGAARAAGIALALLLPAACVGTDDPLRQEAAVRIAESEPAIAGLARERAEGASGVRIAGRPWYGSRLAGADAGAGDGGGRRLPDNLERRDGIALSVPTRSSLAETAELITRTSGLPVTVDLRLPAAGEGDAAGGTAPVPALGQPIRHDGPLSELLDRVGAEFDVHWSFDGSAIALAAYRTRTWPLPVPSASTDISATFGGISGGQDTVSLTRQDRIGDWDEISAMIGASIRPPATVTASPGLGRISVTGRPSDIAAADRIIRDAAGLAGHRISLEVGIYYLDADRSSEFSAGLTRFAEFDGTAAEEPPTALTATGGAVSIIGAEAGLGLEYALDFESIARNNAVVTHRTATTVAVSGAVAPIRLVSTRNYVSSVSVSDEGQRTIETAKVDDGIVIQLLPRLIDRRTLRLSLVVGQADLIGFDIFQDVQLPRVDHRLVANDVLMAPGETLVLSGYEQGTAGIEDRNGFLSAAADANVERVMLVLLVRPTLLPHAAAG